MLDFNTSTGVVLYQLLSGGDFSNGRSLSFLQRSDVGENYTPAGTGNATADPTVVTNGTAISVGAGTWLKGLQSGAQLNTLGTLSAAGNSSNSGLSSSAPKATIRQAMLAAQAARAVAGGAAVEHGCEVRLLPGDYVWKNDGLGGTINNDVSYGYWATITSIAGREMARILPSTTPQSFETRRNCFRNVVIHSVVPEMIFYPNSAPWKAVLWFDQCTISGECPIAGGGLAHSDWGGTYFSSTLTTRKGGGPGPDLIRDCALVDVGGDLLSYSQCVINVDIDLCNSRGSEAMHADIGQYEPYPPGVFDSIIWFNVFARRFNYGHPAPHINGASYTNSAYVNMVEVVTDVARSAGFGAGDFKNVLFWNCTCDAVIGLGHSTAANYAENMSIRSCIFDAFAHGGTAEFYTAWFQNNHYRTTGGFENYLSPGTGVSTGGSRSDLFKSLDALDPAYYMPNSSGPLYGAIPQSQVVIGLDIYGNDHRNGDIGGISLA